MDDLFEKMRLAVLEGEEKAARELAEKALEEKVDLIEAMNNGFLKGIQESGELYGKGEYFLPDIICSADAMKAALELLSPELKKISGGMTERGKVIIATVEGDVHDIGKTIVGAMLIANGFEVQDMGADVKKEILLEAVKEKRPDILALSALLTTTIEEQRNVINALLEEGIRSQVKVIVGGAPVSREWAQKIGADGYSDNAMDAVKLVTTLLS